MRRSPVLVALALLFAVRVSIAGTTSPPPASAPHQVPVVAAPGAIKAVVVRSWGAGSVQLAWDYLNANWSAYGSIPIFIDATTLHGTTTITLAELQNSGADVVIVSDPAGGGQLWTAAEAAALGTYASQGHPLIGTYLLLGFQGVDNRALAPLWGLRSDQDYNADEVPSAPSADILASSSCLFSRIAPPLDQGGYPFVQVPLDGSWDPADLAGAVILARSPDGRNVVTSYSSGNLQATYISYMPEYQDGSQFDATQYLYNAIVCPFAATPATRSTWGRVKSLYR